MFKNKEITEEAIIELYKTILKLGTVEDCDIFFDDLCTKKEVEQMAQRLKAAKLLKEGKTYIQVIDETDISSATLSRVSRCVQYGTGYNKMIKTKK